MPITSLTVDNEPVDIFEGQGQKGDIVVIGERFDRLGPADVGRIFIGDKTRVLSTTSGFHGRNLRLINRYLMETEGLSNDADPMVIAGKSVRFNVTMDGPEKTFILDSIEGSPRAEKAVKVLTDLGVKRERIMLDKSQFRSTIL